MTASRKNKTAARQRSQSRSAAPPVAHNEKFRVTRLVVTPELAAKWLEKNLNNRKLTKPLEDNTVQRYARDMKAGRWHLTGDAIQFDTEGLLMDGQHRLWACVLADQPFESSVAYNVDPGARIVIDTGKKRTLGNYFTMAGEGDAISLAAAVNLAIRWDMGNIAGDGTLIGARYVVNHEEAVDWLTENGAIRQSVTAGRLFYREMRYGLTAGITAHYLNSRVDSDASDEFWQAATLGTDLPAGSPILALRRWIVNQQTRRGGNLPSDLVLVHYLKAMAMWKAGRTVRILSVKQGEQIGTWER